MGDLSILPHPLTHRDIIYLRAFYDHKESLRRLPLDDAVFYLARLSACFTGDKGLEHSPSHVMYLAECYKRQNKAKK